MNEDGVETGCQERYYLSVADLVCVAMLLSATSSGVKDMVVFTARGDVKCKWMIG